MGNLSGMFGITTPDAAETVTFDLWPSHREELTRLRDILDDSLRALDDLLDGRITPETRATIRSHTNGFGEWRPVETTTVPGILYDVRTGAYNDGDPTHVPWVPEEEKDD